MRAASARNLSFTQFFRRGFGADLLQLRGDPVEASVDPVDVGVGWYPQPLERSLNGFVGPTLQVFAPFLHLVSQVRWNVEGLADVIQQCLSTFLDDFARPPLLSRQHDLRQRDLREVVSIVAVDDFDLVTVAHELRNSLERYVAARASVIELAICVLLDKVSLRGCSHGRAHSNAVRYVLRPIR
jgi:hypothetical protein